MTVPKVPEKAVQWEDNQVSAGKQCEELNSHQQPLNPGTVLRKMPEG